MSNQVKYTTKQLLNGAKKVLKALKEEPLVHNLYCKAPLSTIPMEQWKLITAKHFEAHCGTMETSGRIAGLVQKSESRQLSKALGYVCEAVFRFYIKCISA